MMHFLRKLSSFLALLLIASFGAPSGFAQSTTETIPLASYSSQPHWLTVGHTPMRSVLVGQGVPIVYRARVESGQDYTVVLGLGEAHYSLPGQRVLLPNIEGSETTRTIDVAAAVGRNVPYAVAMSGRDADGDGLMRIELRAAPDSPDPNPVLSGLWVFSRTTWESLELTTEEVLAGHADGDAFYFVDCGADLFSDRVLSHDAYLEALGRRVAPIPSLLATQPLVASLTTDTLAGIDARFQALESIYERGGLSFYEAQLRALEKELAQAGEKIVEAMLDRLAPTPVWRKPSVVMLSSPWMGKATIEQRDALRLKLEVHPLPTTTTASYHSQWAYPKQDVLGPIEIAPVSPFQDISTVAGLDYNLALTSVDYDPLATTFAYLDGAVTFRVLDGAGFLVESTRTPLRVRVERDRLRDEGFFLSAQGEVQGIPLHCGIIFDASDAERNARLDAEGDVLCERFAVFWADTADELAARAEDIRQWDRTRVRAERWIREATRNPRLTGLSSLTNQVEMNKRILLSMGFVSGGMYAAMDEYEHLWVRDVANAVIFPALAGDPTFLQRWTPYALSNPAHIEREGQAYEGYFTWITTPDDQQGLEQDGAFFATLSAYAFWKLTGDDERLREWYVRLSDAARFLDDTCFDTTLDLYGEWYINEAPLANAPMFLEQYPLLKIGGKWPKCLFSLSLNTYMYSMRLMLAEMAEAIGEGELVDEELRRADSLAAAIDEHLWNDEAGHYRSALAQLEDGEIAEVDWEYSSIYLADIWAFSLYPMVPDAEKRLASLDAILNERDGIFPGYDTRLYFSAARAHASYVYAAEGQPDKAMVCLRRLTERSRDVDWTDESPVVYAMAGAMGENIHDFSIHRPQTFGIGPYQYAAASLGYIVDYNGVTAAPSVHLSGAEGVRFRDAVLSFDLEFFGQAVGIRLDGQPIRHTMRIPSSLLTPGEHRVEILSEEESAHPVLAHTPFELLSVEAGEKDVLYTLRGYGGGTLRFVGAIVEDDVTVLNADGGVLPFRLWQAQGGSRVQVDARGPFTVRVNRPPTQEDWLSR